MRSCVFEVPKRLGLTLDEDLGGLLNSAREPHAVEREDHDSKHDPGSYFQHGSIMSLGVAANRAEQAPVFGIEHGTFQQVGPVGQRLAQLLVAAVALA